MKKRNLAIIIPAHNEAKVIKSTLKRLLAFFPKEDIYLVSDGSTDSTVRISAQLIQNVHSSKVNRGKAKSLNLAIDKYNLVDRYHFVMPLDADTLITKDYIKLMLNTFYKNKNTTAVVGRIQGTDYNWLTSFRLWEYEVGHSIHKSAQSALGTIMVCSGCSTIYRTKLFKKIKFSSDTVTEDMDLTFSIHRQKLGRIIYCDKARVITQDPNNLVDYIKQTDRWYTGLWQCIHKHNIPWEGQMIDVEVAVLASEGIFSGLFVPVFILSSPFIILTNPAFFFLPIGLDIAIFLVPTLILAMVRQRPKNLIRYIPQIYFTRFLTSLVFIKSFANVVLDVDLRMLWFRPSRYKIA